VGIHLHRNSHIRLAGDKGEQNHAQYHPEELKTRDGRSALVCLWEVISVLGADSGRMTGNSDVTPLGKGCRPPARSYLTEK